MHHPGTDNLIRSKPTSQIRQAIIVVDLLECQGWHSHATLSSVLNTNLRQSYRWLSAVDKFWPVQRIRTHGKETIFMCQIQPIALGEIKLPRMSKAGTLLKAVLAKQFINASEWHTYSDICDALGVGAKQGYRWVQALEACGVPLEFRNRNREFRKLHWKV